MSVFLQVLHLNKAEDAHNEYQSLLSEINNPNTKYILRAANRLYGEKTFEFLSVSNHYICGIFLVGCTCSLFPLGVKGRLRVLLSRFSRLKSTNAVDYARAWCLN